MNVKKIRCIIIVGKPGAGKSTIGTFLSELLGAEYMSLGSFMRGHLNIPDPHIGVDKRIVYNALLDHFGTQNDMKTLVLDCHPYPEDDLNALKEFIEHPSLTLWAVVHVDADDAVALKRLEARPRPGQTYSERLAYYNENKPFIERLLEHPRSIRVENNHDFEDLTALKNVAETLHQRLLERQGVLI